MLRCADKEIQCNTTQKALVGKIGQGRASKARIEPTGQIIHQMRGVGTWRHAEGGPLCLYCKASMVHTSIWLG